jgi:hypothetical protein
MSDFSKAELKLRITAWLEKANHHKLDLLHKAITPCLHPSTINKGESHYCTECKSYVGDGWWCPSSPDNHCYYFTDFGSRGTIVVLADGTNFDYRGYDEDHDPEYETDDCCLFCGQPDERK